MSPPFPFQLVIFFFLLVVGLGGLFPTTSALCGNETGGCSNGESFGYPFSYNDSDCGYPGLTFTCSNDDGDSRSVLNVSNDLYYILDKDMESRRLGAVGVDVYDEDCPRPMHNFTLPTTSPFSDPYTHGFPMTYSYYNDSNITYFYNCSSGYPKDVVQDLPCLDTYYNNNTTPGLRSFAFFYYKDSSFNWYTRNCQESVGVPIRNIVFSDPKSSLKEGFDLKWSTPEECKECEKSGGQCWFNHTTAHACSCPQDGTTDERRLFDKACPQRQGPTTSPSQPPNTQPGTGPTTSQSQPPNTQPGPIPTSHQTAHRGVPTELKIILGVCSGVGGLLLVTLFICHRKLFLIYNSIVSHWNSKIKSPTNMEAFLESCGLQRYKYSQVKKMTNTFKEKLGQGGFGSVFKGKFPDGRMVAVKLLDESKGNGQDFINEVATIGSTNHVNIVRLLGFCCNGNKRALVYEFMPNGSLDKFIYNRENTSITNPSLGPEKLYQLALGIAKGLEYLHCGCNTRILHFDIKPHNILLDQDFCPKIADFGLAKLCHMGESIVSMHVARGTMGYIAPEVTCRNLGGVSHKSDVYSYGMMILEMIGGRKNIDITVENTSEIYFPQWIYNHLKRDIDVGEAKEFYTEKTIKRMIVVALWCIQTQPSDRPSISKVVEMLEENVDELQMPSNLFQGSPSRSSH